MIIYLSDPKNFTRELLHLMNIFSKVAGRKINLPKLVVYIHKNDKGIEKEIMEIMHLTMASKK